jgi:hydroxylamine dehydrogenase
MSFRSVFIAVVVAFGLIVAASLLNRARPKVETEQPSAELVRATGKCAECHARTQYAVVHQYEMSAHARKGVNGRECHPPAAGQEKKDHHGFVIATTLTAGNCRGCQENIYQQFLRSRHAAPAWAAIYGEKGLTPDFVQWQGNYPMLRKTVELQSMAAELRRQHGTAK